VRRTIRELDGLRALGFDIEPFGGNTFLVRAVPALMIQDDIAAAVCEFVFCPTAFAVVPPILLAVFFAPVVAGNFRGVEDIITEPCAGRILPAATPASLAEAVRELLRARPMPSLSYSCTACA
jgi:hypothetical protein